MYRRVAKHLHRVNSFIQRHAFSSQLVFCLIKTSAADVLAQYVDAKNKNQPFSIDYRRNLCYSIFGAVYCGCIQYVLWISVFKRLFPAMERFSQLPLRAKFRDRAGLSALWKQILIDNTIYTCVFYIPTFYFFLEWIHPEEKSQSKSNDSSLSTLSQRVILRVRENIYQDAITMGKVWIIGDLITYLLPLHYRLLANHSLSFLWTAYLSYVKK